MFLGIRHSFLISMAGDRHKVPTHADRNPSKNMNGNLIIFLIILFLYIKLHSFGKWVNVYTWILKSWMIMRSFERVCSCIWMSVKESMSMLLWLTTLSLTGGTVGLWARGSWRFIQPCWRKSVTIGKLWEFKDSCCSPFPLLACACSGCELSLLLQTFTPACCLCPTIIDSITLGLWANVNHFLYELPWPWCFITALEE